MSESIPPPPKHGGSGGFIAAAVVMLLLMGGLIWWKMKGGDPPKVAEVPPVVSATAPPIMEETLPPPPKIETPDAGVAKTPGKRLGGQFVGAGSCGGPDGCNGQVTSQLKSALQGKAGASRRCYERALMQNSMLQGRIVLGVRVGSNGQVCSANITQNGVGDPGLANCVLGMFRGSSFPAPGGGCVDTAVPMNFVPKN
jgi:hypothetical protein